MTTARFALPLLVPGQTQKEAFHNEALQALELLVQPCVSEIGLNSPPEAPQVGDCFVVGGAPEGSWIGHAGGLALWTAAGWRFAPPFEGMAATSVKDGARLVYSKGAWRAGELKGKLLDIDGKQVVGARSPAIAEPTGGSTQDHECRASVRLILAALRGHGLIEG